MCVCDPVENSLPLGTLEEAGALIGSFLFKKFILNRATSLLSYSHTIRLKEKGVVMFGALKNVKITRIVESRLCRGRFARVGDALALPGPSSPLVVYHLEPETLGNITNVINLEQTKAERLV